MPTYDYRCKACGHELEIFQTMSEGAKRKCPSCGALKLERLIGMGGGVVFKGGGFWQTDYRSESYKSGESADKKAAEAKPKPEKKGEEGAQKTPPSRSKKPESD